MAKEDVDQAQAIRAQLSESAPGCEVWKAVAVGHDKLPQTAASTGAHRLLLDNSEGAKRGGTGTAFDWAKIPDELPRDQIVLAGGLDPHNISQADALGCWALDVNSGVESSPGQKNAEKMKALFAELRRPEGER